MELLDEAKAKRLPAVVRRELKAECGGEWDRVTVERDGSFTVHNNPTLARRALEQLLAATAPPPTPQPAPVQARPPAPDPVPAPTQVPVTDPVAPAPVTPPPLVPVSRREKSPEAALLQGLIGTEAQPAKCGVQVVSAPPRPRETPYRWTFDPESVDWTLADFDQPLVRLRDHLTRGLPPAIPFQYHPDVLAMSGIDLKAFDDAVREPQRVEIRPESRAKKYPILGFYRGDVVAIMGFRTPANPMMIAVYFDAKLQHDTHHLPTTTGGGGARKQHGLPTSTRQMIRAIRQAGCELDYGDELNAKSAEVRYRGQCLGKVSVLDAPRATIQSDYQRIIRKVDAIDRREVATGAGRLAV